MTYSKKQWVDDEVIERSEMQNIEDGINAAHDNIDSHIADATTHLTSAQNDGLDGANAPGSDNVFATILDIALTIDDTAYNESTWNGDIDAASKNAIRDKIVIMDSNIAINTTHKTSDGSDHTFIDQDVTSGSSPTIVGTNVTAIPASNINFTVLGTPTYKTAQDWFNVIQTSGIISGFTLSNSRSATELDVAAGTGIVKTTDSEIGSSVSFDFTGVQNVTLTGNNINYIYLDYNIGTPQIVATTNRALIELNRHFIIGRVYKNNSTLHILNAGVHLPNMARNEHERLVERDGFTYASGAITSETGTLNLTVTAGVWFLGHNRLTTDALNSSVSDTWEYTHYGAASWITDNATATAVDTTHYNDGTDVLASLGSNNYGIQWVYLTTDSHLYVIYGTINGTLSVAQAAIPPASIPSYLEHMGELLAKIIHKEDGTIISIEIIQEVAFTATGVPDHNDTGNLQGGIAGEYYHLTSAEQTIVNNTSGTNTGDDPANNTIYNESTWNTNLDAATKNAIRDKIELMITDINTNLAKVTNATHTGDVTGSGELTIANDVVTYSKIQNVVNDERILGRVSGADGVVEELTKAQVLSMINVEDDADVTDTANVTSAGAFMDSEFSNQSFTNLLKNGDFESWSAGASAVPDNYNIYGAGLVIAKEATIIKISTSSAKLTRNSTNCTIYQNIKDSLGINYCQNRIFTLSVWVYATVANSVRIAMQDGVGQSYSAYHSGNSSWELLTTTHTVNNSATDVKSEMWVNTNNTSGYFDGAILVEGSVCPAFSPHPTDQIPTVLTSAPTDAGANGETRWYAIAGAGGARRMYMSNGTDWKYIAIST